MICHCVTCRTDRVSDGATLLTAPARRDAVLYQAGSFQSAGKSRRGRRMVSLVDAGEAAASISAAHHRHRPGHYGAAGAFLDTTPGRGSYIRRHAGWPPMPSVRILAQQGRCAVVTPT